MRTWLLAVSLLLASTAFAQLPINIGIKAGANYSLIQTDANGISTNGKASYLGGAFGRLKIKKFTAQIEALYVDVNGELEDDFLGTTRDIKYGNLDVPLLVGYRFLDLKVLKLGVNAGITQSVNLTKSGDLPKDGFEDGYTSGTIGVAADIPLFIFDVRYQHGLGDYYASPGFESQNNMLTLSVAWKII